MPTREVVHLHHAAAFGYKNTGVRTPNTDISEIHLFHVHAINLSIYLDTGPGTPVRLLDVSEPAESLGEEYCANVLGFYVFNGEE